MYNITQNKTYLVTQQLLFPYNFFTRPNFFNSKFIISFALCYPLVKKQNNLLNTRKSSLKFCFSEKLAIVVIKFMQREVNANEHYKVQVFT